MAERLYAGIDLGTSGARVSIIDDEGTECAAANIPLARFGADLRDPAIWWKAAETAFEGALDQIDRTLIMALAVDGTSGTMVAIDWQGRPLGPGLLYNDACSDAEVVRAIDEQAPRDSAARGTGSALARAITLARRFDAADMLLHQADWLAWHFTGRFVSDENNALKTGYDPVSAAWPDWIARTEMNPDCLPGVLPAGQAVGPVTRQAADRFGLSPQCRVVAGTTDGCASFLATGASVPGEACTALGTTMTLKLLSDRPISSPSHGVYSHRLLGMWLAGGASNTGGGALLAHFEAEDLALLSAKIDPGKDSGLDYYPLPRPGERFPVDDANFAPHVAPRPADDAAFLHGLLEGIARIEARGYGLLCELGAPPLQQVRSVGGGAANTVWTAIRGRILRVPMKQARSSEAAYGTALLARAGSNT